MKKSLVALAALAFVGAASAQSTVTLFGVVDATYQHGSGSTAAGGNSVSRLGNSGYNSSRLGFRGVEDLGGGMWAGFWLEAGLNNDNGTGAGTSSNNQWNGGTATVGGTTSATGAVTTRGIQGLTFNRRSTVSLGGNWGELRMGRDYTPAFWNYTVFDPFGTNGVGTNIVLTTYIGGVTAAGLGTSSGGATSVRASNSIQYLTPGCQTPAGCTGFYGQAMYAMGENASPAANSNDGRHIGFRAGYAQGPFNVALGYGKTSSNAAAAVAGASPIIDGNFNEWNIGGSYDFGVAKLIGQYNRQNQDDANGTVGVNVTAKGYLLGGLIPAGPGTVRLSYSHQSVSSAGTNVATFGQWAAGYVYDFSKRTSAYVTYARVNNPSSNTPGFAVGLNGAASTVGNSSSGYDIGLKHTF